MSNIISHADTLLRVGKPHPRTLRRWVNAGKFPAPLKISENKIGWYESEVEDWLEARPRVNYAPSPLAVAA